MEKPFVEGDVVKVKGSDHLGLFSVDECEWFESTRPEVAPYWLCKCSGIREPIDWGEIPAGATGIVTSSGWSGSAKHLVMANL